MRDKIENAFKNDKSHISMGIFTIFPPKIKLLTQKSRLHFLSCTVNKLLRFLYLIIYFFPFF